MAEIGKYYIEIVPSAKGISSKISDTLKGPAIQASSKIGSAMGPAITTGLQSIGAGMTRYITKPALAAVGALGGATLFAGWKRMTEIDNAKVKLEAIGNTTKDVAKIQENAMEAVKGTAYGMDAAMTTSAAAVAAGIQPGKELTKYLTAISDASAVAGTDMASMGAIFNKVATSGKAQNDVLGQLADQGIPIYQYLAEQMGVTADKVFEMASKGEVGLADFQAAVSTHIGGAAKEIGSKTITGAISNVRAAISRIGANFLGSADDADSFAGKILPMLNNLMTNLEPVEEKAKELGSQFADAFGKFAEAVSKIPLPVLGGIAAALVGIGPAVGLFFKLQGILSALGIVISGPVAAIGALIGVLVLAYTQSESFRNAVSTLVTTLISAFAPAINTVIGFIKSMIPVVMEVAKAIGDALAPVIQFVIPLITLLAKVIGVKLKVSLAVIGAVIKTFANAIRAVAAIVQGTFAAINKIVKTAAGPIKSAINGIKKAFTWGNIASKAKSVFNSVKDAIMKPIDSAKDKLKGVVDKIKSFFPINIGKIMSSIKLPHFSVSGGKAPWGFGGMGSLPKVSVSWAAQGGLVDGATLIGAGEKGEEAIVPLDPFWKRLDEMKSGNTFNITMNVDGAKDPSQWAREFSRTLYLEMRTI